MCVVLFNSTMEEQLDQMVESKLVNQSIDQSINQSINQHQFKGVVTTPFQSISVGCAI